MKQTSTVNLTLGVWHGSDLEGRGSIDPPMFLLRGGGRLAFCHPNIKPPQHTVSTQQSYLNRKWDVFQFSSCIIFDFI